MASEAGKSSAAENHDGDGVIDTCFLDSLVGYWLRRASNVIAADFAQAVQEKSGLRAVQASILSVVGSNPGIGQTQLGQALNIQRANMVPLLSGLIDIGLIRREASASDRRVFELFLTDAGLAKLDDTTALIRTHEERMLSELTNDERRTLIDLLAKITAAGAE